MGSLLLGGIGISGLHYTSMAAMRIPGGHHYPAVIGHGDRADRSHVVSIWSLGIRRAIRTHPRQQRPSP